VRRFFKKIFQSKPDIIQYRWFDDGKVCLSLVKYKGGFCYLLERPWIPSERPGGKPFESCVPTGRYRMEPFKRPSGEQVWRLINEDLGVYAEQKDLPAPGKGRFLILWHVGNNVADVVGCGAPGLGQELLPPMVTQSAKAMDRLMESMGWRELTLEIVDAVI